MSETNVTKVNVISTSCEGDFAALLGVVVLAPGKTFNDMGNAQCEFVDQADADDHDDFEEFFAFLVSQGIALSTSIDENENFCF